MRDISRAAESLESGLFDGIATGEPLEPIGVISSCRNLLCCEATREEFVIIPAIMYGEVSEVDEVETQAADHHGRRDPI